MAKKSHQEGVQLQENVQLMSQFQVLAARLLELTSVELEDRVRAELHENPALDEDLHRQSEQELPSQAEKPLRPPSFVKANCHKESTRATSPRTHTKDWSNRGSDTGNTHYRRETNPHSPRMPIEKTNPRP